MIILIGLSGVAAARGLAAKQETASVLADLETRLVPVDIWREQAEAALRSTASPAQRDAEFYALRLRLKQIASTFASGLDASEFQALVWPDGAASQRLRRLQRRPERAESADVERGETIVSFLRARGIWPSRSEGTTYFHASEAALLEWMGDIVSEEVRQFLRLWAREQASPVADDASIQVPLDELEQRILATERFLEQYPESAVRDPARARHRHYVALYLGGTDNTPAFDRRSGLLRPELRQALATYAATNGSHASSRVVADYLDLLRADGFRRSPGVDHFLRGLRAGGDWVLLRY